MIDMNQVPGWGQGTSLWGEDKWQEDYGVSPEQDWYRKPDWGAHVIWNPEKGYQDYTNVGDMYQGGGDFGGLTTHLGGDWSQYYPNAPVLSHEQKQPGYGQGQQLPGNWGDMVNQWGDWMGQNRQGRGNWGTQINDIDPQGGWGQQDQLFAGGQGDGSQPPPGYEHTGTPPPQGSEYGYGGAFTPSGGGQPPGQQPQTGGFQYPSQWGTASDVMTQFAQGLPTQTPWQWQQGSDIASQMAQTGMPTSYEPMYQQAKGIAERDTSRAIDQAAEQAGLQGLRWSTPLGQTAQRIAGENMANLGLGFAGQEMGALEAARGRQMGGVGQLQGFGAGTAGLTEAAKNRGMQAAGGLTGLGQQYLDAPQDWAAQMYQMGGGMRDQGQAGLDRYRQDYMRLAPEFNPFVDRAMSYWGTPSQMQYQQYNPSAMSQIMGGAGNLGMMGMGLGSLCG